MSKKTPSNVPLVTGISQTATKFRNKITGELYFAVKNPLIYVDGVAFRVVTRPNQPRHVMIRNDSLERVP